jgi:hypothetical protein
MLLPIIRITYRWYNPKLDSLKSCVDKRTFNQDSLNSSPTSYVCSLYMAMQHYYYTKTMHNKLCAHVGATPSVNSLWCGNYNILFIINNRLIVLGDCPKFGKGSNEFCFRDDLYCTIVCIVDTEVCCSLFV